MPARSWLKMLGHMSDLEKFVHGARLRMRPFQYYIRRVWNRDAHGMDILIPIPQELKKSLIWWANPERIKRGMSLEVKMPDLMLFTDASRQSWGAIMGDRKITAPWSPKEQKEHINVLELRAIFYALKHLEEVVRGRTVAIFADNTTALSYIRKQGGTNPGNCSGWWRNSFCGPRKGKSSWFRGS